MSCFLKYIHPKSLKKVKAWEKEFGVEITASKPSKTRLGVFIVKKHAPNIIKINNDLNKYSFLIILIHELAHASVWKKFGRQVNPHGKEWKHEFQRMMLPFLTPEFFSHDILRELSNHLINPPSSIARDIALSTTLRRYDNRHTITISNIQDGDIFITPNGKKFKRICKLRKNYKCVEISSKKNYRFSPIAEVILL